MIHPLHQLVNGTRQALACRAWRRAALTEQPDELPAAICAALRQDGIACSYVTELGLAEAFANVAALGARLAADERVRRAGADPSGSKHRKDFWLRLLGTAERWVMELDAPGLLALHPTLLDIANAHLRCHSWLMDYNLWLNVPTPANEPRSSQLWHRDYLWDARGFYTDRLEPLVKVFICLEDPEPGQGALYYIRGSHVGGLLQDLHPDALLVEDNLAARISDGSMAACIPPSEWVTVALRAGDVVFFDVSGLHKGGFVTSGRRLVFKAEYGTWRWRSRSQPRLHIAELALRKRGLIREAQRWAVRS